MHRFIHARSYNVCKIFFLEIFIISVFFFFSSFLYGEDSLIKLVHTFPETVLDLFVSMDGSLYVLGLKKIYIQAHKENDWEEVTSTYDCNKVRFVELNNLSKKSILPIRFDAIYVRNCFTHWDKVVLDTKSLAMVANSESVVIDFAQNNNSTLFAVLKPLKPINIEEPYITYRIVEIDRKNPNAFDTTIREFTLHEDEKIYRAFLTNYNEWLLIVKNEKELGQIQEKETKSYYIYRINEKNEKILVHLPFKLDLSKSIYGVESFDLPFCFLSEPIMSNETSKLNNFLYCTQDRSLDIWHAIDMGPANDTANKSPIDLALYVSPQHTFFDFTHRKEVYEILFYPNFFHLFYSMHITNEFLNHEKLDKASSFELIGGAVSNEKIEFMNLHNSTLYFGAKNSVYEIDL